MSHYAHSKIPRRARSVPVEYGELFGSIFKSTTTRMTEVYAGERAEFGELISATNNAATLYDPKALRCSCCGKRKHMDDFHRNRTFTWRFGREYQCKLCAKLQDMQQQARRRKAS
jgi:hypothetical protein